ncbi:MAG: lipid-A-disaccharide synthase [Flavobacteriales bacterium]|nr:lipid-A-disaccharide synthase [Flavobacteriales bacterium]
MAKRLYIIAGEASGDLHGANLVRELFACAAPNNQQPTTNNDPPNNLSIRAWGGDRMSAAGADVVKHYRELAFMGFTQVIMNLRTILRNIDVCKQDIETFKPDAIILIDYPGFNLRIAEWAHAKGIPVHYYISPQVWAWKKGRVHTIKRVVDRMYVILPFEKEWYAKYGMDVEFVGHPLLDAIAQEGSAALKPLPGDDARPVVALLPGSRQQEIHRILPLMVSVAGRFPQYRFVLAAAPSIPDGLYMQFIGTAPIEVIKDRTYDVLRHARAALVTSGTATLETALFGVPEAVCYSGSALNVWIARRLVDIEFISLVNLIMGKEVVRELIQSDLTVDSMAKELEQLMADGPYRDTMLNSLTALRIKLGGPGASHKVASAVWKSLAERPASR